MRLLTILVFIATANFLTAEVDLSKSSFKWSATKKVGDGHYGKVSLKSASVESSGGEISSGEFVIDMDSITVDDLSGKWATKFLKHIKNEDFFEIQKYPTAKFKLEKVSDGYLYGKLTIKDKTNDVSMPYEKSGKSYKGTLAFDRTKFDMIYGSDNFFKNLGDKVINDTVKVEITVALK